MTSPHLSAILPLYREVAPVGVLEYLQKQAGLSCRRGIYVPQVVLWLMIAQRLQARGTLAHAVQLLQAGAVDALLPDCRRVREGRVSSRTGGYCQARQKLPKMWVRQVSDEILERLRGKLSEGKPAPPQPVFVLDGSTLQLEHEAELVRHYPPGRNQHGVGHWPMLRMVVLHEVATGLAQPPCWGPMHGAKAVSEQALAERAMASVPGGAVVMGDRNFGIFATAWAAQQRQLGVVVRLTQVRAKKLAGGPISREGDYRVGWRASRWDGGQPRSWPAEAEIPGRLIAWRVGRGRRKSWLYLFTTVDWPAEEVVAWYGRRWYIETDLRALKRTVRLYQLTARSEAMMEKELLVATAAYNLVRAVICLAARRAGVDPRQLSFSHVLNVVSCSMPRLAAATTPRQQHQQFQRVLDLAAQGTLPKRRKRRCYPRAVWGRGAWFPTRKAEKTK